MHPIQFHYLDKNKKEKKTVNILGRFGQNLVAIFRRLKRATHKRSDTKQPLHPNIAAFVTLNLILLLLP